MSDLPDQVDQNADASGNGEDKRPSYESYQKLLAEKKAVQEKARKLEDDLKAHNERLAEINREKEESERKKLEDKEQFKDLYGKVKEELASKEKALAEMLREKVDTRKMASFLEAVKADVPRQYWNLVDLDQIAMDGEKVDEFSVQKYVETFRDTYKEVIKAKDGRRMPVDQPDPDERTTLTYAQWLKLPAKEQEAKIGLVKG